MVNPLKKRIMTLHDLRIRTMKVLNAVRKHLGKPTALAEMSDNELIDTVIEPLLTDIIQDIDIERIHNGRTGS